MAAGPDVKNGIHPALLMGGISAVILIIFVVGILIYKSSSSAPEEMTDSNLFEGAALPSDFFDVQREPEPEPKPEPEPLPPPPPPQPVVIEKVKLISANDAFQTVPEIDPEVLARLNFKREFNAQRRGAGILLLEQGKATYNKPADTWTNTDKDFGNTPKDIASFPVNLERTITADRMIPAILINAIQSDLAGKVVAQVEQHVYGAHGKNVLIPAGSKAIGYYEPLKKVGEERVAIVWKRIITPQGININTTEAELADAMGRSGITGEVDTRNFDRYGMAFLVSTINALSQATIPVTSESQRIALETYGRDTSQITGKILEEQLDIKPRVNIPAGARILINPTTDIWFKEPVKNVIQVKPANS